MEVSNSAVGLGLFRAHSSLDRVGHSEGKAQIWCTERLWQGLHWVRCMFVEKISRKTSITHSLKCTRLLLIHHPVDIGYGM